MAQGTINFDISPLIKRIEKEIHDLKALSSEDIGFGITNVAKDEGRKSSTGIFYFDLVDKGRAGFIVNQDEKVPYTTRKGEKKLRRKVLAWRTTPTQWHVAIEVGPAPPLRLSQKINDKIKNELPKIMKQVLGNRSIPFANDIRKINDLLKERVLVIAKEVTMQSTKQHHTRKTFYNINAAVALSDGYRITKRNAR